MKRFHFDIHGVLPLLLFPIILVDGHSDQMYLHDVLAKNSDTRRKSNIRNLAFVQSQPITKKSSFASSSHRKIILFAESNQQNDGGEQKQKEQNETVQLGSKEYYSGFVSRDVNQEPEERVTGDAILIPTLKFVGGFASVLALLFFVFLASNDLI